MKSASEMPASWASVSRCAGLVLACLLSACSRIDVTTTSDGKGVALRELLHFEAWFEIGLSGLIVLVMVFTARILVLEYFRASKRDSKDLAAAAVMAAIGLFIFWQLRTSLITLTLTVDPAQSRVTCTKSVLYIPVKTWELPYARVRRVQSSNGYNPPVSVEVTSDTGAFCSVKTSGVSPTQWARFRDLCGRELRERCPLQ